MSKNKTPVTSVDWRRRVLNLVKERAAAHGVSLEAVLAPHGPRHVGVARKDAVAHAKDVTGYSFRAIAEAIGKDAKAVTRAVREAEAKQAKGRRSA